jgi:hypothetical protein
MLVFPCPTLTVHLRGEESVGRCYRAALIFGLRSNAALPLFDDAVQSAQQTAVLFLHLCAFAPLR